MSDFGPTQVTRRSDRGEKPQVLSVAVISWWLVGFKSCDPLGWADLNPSSVARVRVACLEGVFCIQSNSRSCRKLAAHEPGFLRCSQGTCCTSCPSHQSPPDSFLARPGWRTSIISPFVPMHRPCCIAFCARAPHLPCVSVCPFRVLSMIINASPVAQNSRGAASLATGPRRFLGSLLEVAGEGARGSSGGIAGDRDVECRRLTIRPPCHRYYDVSCIASTLPTLCSSSEGIDTR